VEIQTCSLKCGLSPSLLLDARGLSGNSRCGTGLPWPIAKRIVALEHSIMERKQLLRIARRAGIQAVLAGKLSMRYTG
jgi:hypothetical protein